MYNKKRYWSLILIENSKMCMSCINDLRIWKNTFLLKLRDQGPGFRFSFKLLSSSQSSLILMQNLVSKDRGLYNTSLRAPFKKYRHFFQIKFFKFKSRYFWWISSHHFFIELEIFATFLKRWSLKNRISWYFFSWHNFLISPNPFPKVMWVATKNLSLGRLLDTKKGTLRTKWMEGRKGKKEDEESKLSVNMLVNPNMKGKTRKWFQSIYNLETLLFNV